jgi:hypothetical protein
MNCGRCHGWMKRYHASELHEQGTRLSLRAWLCGGCGHVREEIVTCTDNEPGRFTRIAYSVAA